jgi:hypothetical protein
MINLTITRLRSIKENMLPLRISSIGSNRIKSDSITKRWIINPEMNILNSDLQIINDISTNPLKIA